MRGVFFSIGALAFVTGAALLVATALAKFTPLTGYSAGASVVLGGVIMLLAALKRYRGHWSFVTGISLCTLALAGFGGDIDAYASGGEGGDFLFGAFLALMFFAFGALSLASSYKLHRCLVRLEQIRTEPDYEDYSI